MLSPIVTDLDSLHETIQKFEGQSQDKPIYLVFYADWCPDCQHADPLIKKTFGKDGHPVAIQVMVGERPVWKTPSNSFRQQPWSITNIPTLVKYQSGKELGRLVEAEILDESKLTSFVE